MVDPAKTIFLCSCEGTMPLDVGAAQRGCHGAKIETAGQLCRAEIERFRSVVAAGTSSMVGCTQEAPLFAEVAREANKKTDVTFVNLRETAGWSSQSLDAGPKMAALLASAAETVPPASFVTLSSEGVILIYGRDEKAIEAGNLLAQHLDVTVMISGSAALTPPRIGTFPIVKGTIRSAKGHLGSYEIVVDDFATAEPSSRGALAFGNAHNGALSRCDVILDISGNAPLFAAHELRDGYLRADFAIRPQCYARCSRRAICPAPSRSRVISHSPKRFVRIRVPASSAAAVVSISVRPARSNRPATTSPSMPTSAPVAANAQRLARPAPLPTHCRQLTY